MNIAIVSIMDQRGPIVVEAAAIRGGGKEVFEELRLGGFVVAEGARFTSSIGEPRMRLATVEASTERLQVTI